MMPLAIFNLIGSDVGAGDDGLSGDGVAGAGVSGLAHDTITKQAITITLNSTKNHFCAFFAIGFLL
jgi:hypothetical protein